MLRPYQSRALDAARRHYAAGVPSVLLTGPPGCGKGTVAAAVCRGAVDKGRRALFVVHRREIVLDVANRIRATGVPVGVLLGSADRGDPAAPVQVCSVQTLAARGERPPADLIIWDECHHVAANSYRDVASAYPDARHLGLSATPERADGAPLGDAFKAIVILATPSELIAEGFLVPYDVIAPAGRVRGVVDPVSAWRTHALGKKTVVFALTVRHAQEIAKAFTDAGITSGCVFGETPVDERADTIARFTDGEITVLVNVMCLTEGTDIPAIECVVLARAMSHVSLYLQSVGRAGRPFPGKESALVLDLVGAVHAHGLPDEDRVFSLEGEAISRKPGAQIRQCRACGAVYLPRPTCPICGWQAPPAELPDVVHAELQRIAKTEDRKAREYNWLVAEAARRGYRPGWAAHRFKAKFGHFPTERLAG